MTAAEFIAAFPPFKDEPVEDIDRQIAVAVLFLDQGRWGTQYAYGLGLYVAHLIVTEKQEAAALAGAANPNNPNSWLPIKSKTNDTVSITWGDRPADWLLRSTYGERFKAMMRTVGFGAVAV